MNENTQAVMDIADILHHLPHRYPFLLIDRVTELVLNEHLVGYKNVTYNEPFFNGHFPQKQIMPGVLILEALAQATGLLAFRSVERKADSSSLYYLVGIDKARFKRPVVPGDRLILDVTVQAARRKIWRFTTEARVDDQVVTSAEIMCTEREIDA